MGKTTAQAWTRGPARRSAVLGALGVAVGLVLISAPPSADAFAFDADPTAAARWSAAPDGPGLADGITFSVDGGFCAGMLPSFIDGTSCPELIQAFYDALAAWERANSNIRFVDTSAEIPATQDGSDGVPSGAGAEIDLFARPADVQTALQGKGADSTAILTTGPLTYSNGEPGHGRHLVSVDLTFRHRTGCTDPTPGCWTKGKFTTIVTHELGHALGLGHPFEKVLRWEVADRDCASPTVARTVALPESVMNYEATGRNAATVTDDDRDGLLALYPTCSKGESLPGALPSGVGATAVPIRTTAAYAVQDQGVPWLLAGILGGAGVVVVGGATLAFLVFRKPRARTVELPATFGPDGRLRVPGTVPARPAPELGLPAANALPPRPGATALYRRPPPR